MICILFTFTCLLMCICKYHTWRRTWNHIGYALPQVKHWSFHHLLRQVLPNVDRRQPSGKILHAPPDKRQRNINQIIWPCSQPSLPFFTFCFPYEVARINATTFSTFLNISQHTSRIFFLVFPCLGSFAVWSISRSFRLDPVKVARVLCSGSCRRLFRISLVVHAVHAPSKTIT